MKTYAIVGVAAVVALCGCGRGRPSQQETIASTATDSVDRPLTIAGCLVPTATTTQSGAARPSDNPPPPSFTLVDITIPAPGAAAPSGVSGTSGSGGSASLKTGAPQSYKLVADRDRLNDLQRFANSRVEVSGLIVTSTGTGTPDVGAASALVGAPPNDVRRVQVKDVRRLEPTCASKKQ
jgi:hypothetical protein